MQMHIHVYTLIYSHPDYPFSAAGYFYSGENRIFMKAVVLNVEHLFDLFATGLAKVVICHI